MWSNFINFIFANFLTPIFGILGRTNTRALPPGPVPVQQSSPLQVQSPTQAQTQAPVQAQTAVQPQVVQVNGDGRSRLTATLNGLLGTNIRDICEHGLHQQDLNHCAHFVSHVMGYHFGYTCKMMTGGMGAGRGENVRVHETFAQCGQVGVWDDGNRPSGPCLAFVTARANVRGNVMTNVPRKHIGIFTQGYIYHYSNGRNQVIRQTPQEFQRHYRGNTITVFYGTFPASA